MRKMIVLLIGLVFLGLLVIPATAANITPYGFKDLDSAFKIPTLKPLSYKTYDAAFAAPTVKPLSYKTYDAAFSVPTIKRSS